MPLSEHLDNDHHSRKQGENLVLRFHLASLQPAPVPMMESSEEVVLGRLVEENRNFDRLTTLVKPSLFESLVPCGLIDHCHGMRKRGWLRLERS